MDNLKKTVINTLINYFEVDGWPYEVDYQKLINRNTISSDESEPGWKIVEIERHRRILGGSYTKGLPMSAYETYSMRYAVNVSDSQVQELPEKHQEYMIDISGLVSSYLDSESFYLTIKPVDEINYKIFEDVSKESGTVSNLEEAKEFVARFIVRNVEFFELQLDINELQIDESQSKEYRSRFEKSLKETLLEKVEDLWESRDLEK